MKSTKDENNKVENNKIKNNRIISDAIKNNKRISDKIENYKITDVKIEDNKTENNKKKDNEIINEKDKNHVIENNKFNKYKTIFIKGAREHNLKNVDVKIPRDSFTVITGVSGSGKSSLAFDTLYAEGQRRYIESLSSYARQFLGLMKKPDVDYIEGLSPAISIEQKKLNRNPRSTVGTITEIYDYLRLLYTHIGEVYCYNCGRKIESQTIDQIVDSIMGFEEGTRLIITAPLAINKKGSFVSTFNNLKKMGFYRVMVDSEMRTLDEKIELDKNRKHTIYAVIDRIILKKDKKKRVFEAVEQALSLGKERTIVLIENKENDLNVGDNNINKSANDDINNKEKNIINNKDTKNINKIDNKNNNNYNKYIEKIYSTKFSCNYCDISYPDIIPALFSFNSPQGACPECHGLGFKMEFDEDKVLDKNLSIKKGAIKPYNYEEGKWYTTIIKSAAKEFDIPLDKPLNKVDQEKINILLYGSYKNIKIDIKSDNYSYYREKPFEGIIPNLKRRYNETNSEYIREELSQYMREDKCSVCKGNRLNKYALSIKINGLNIIELTRLTVEKIYNFLIEVEENLTENQRIIVKDIMKELKNRLSFLKNVGLSYLTLDRMAYTLSGGEAQRINLATQIGSQLVGVMYVLDEPTIGLHQKDNEKLLSTLKNLQSLGNTLIVVEHDKQTIETSDYIVDLGPRAGINGGKVVYQGVTKDFLNSNTLTAKYMRMEKYIPLPSSRRKGNGEFLELKGAFLHNLKNIDVKIPLGTLTVVTGVSGSGKSTLIIDLLYDALHELIYNNKEPKEKYYKKIIGYENIAKVLHIDQSPIGRTPRSNPATYTGVFTHIRDLFANLKDSKIRGYKPGRFSFNVKGGRCENCKGAGVIKIEMQFLPDVFVKCEVCGGKRFNSQTLEIYYKGKNIYDILEMSIDEAYEFFKNIPSIEKNLKFLKDVGLGYIKLGQPATTLSGGEAQRIKLTRELSKRLGANNLYLLDEPTTGLHFDDVAKLIKVLQRLVDKGHTVVVIEHNMDIIKSADYIVDLGPDGGEGGGEIVYQGYFDKFLKCKKSYTAQYLLKEPDFKR